MKDNLNELYNILSYILTNYGEEVFRTKKFIAMLSDIAPNLTEEMIVTKKLFENGIISQIMDTTYDKNSIDREVAKYSLILKDRELIHPEISSPYIFCYICLFNEDNFQNYDYQIEKAQSKDETDHFNQPIVSSKEFYSNSASIPNVFNIENSEVKHNGNLKNDLLGTVSSSRLSDNQSASSSVQFTKPKSIAIAALLAFFLGTFGIHRFYLGYPKSGIIILILFLIGVLMVALGVNLNAILICYGIGIYSLIDVIRILVGNLQPAHGHYNI